MSAAGSRKDTGHDIFHADAGGGIACASCHPEGGDDGRIWQFDLFGSRRTPALRFGILGTEPFHWGGDLADMPALSTEVFEHRMGGAPLRPDQVQALAHWVDRVPLLPKAPPADPDAVARGKALFEDQGTACLSCHGGDKLTNTATVDVGTGGALQVPSLLGLVEHAPYLHDGRAATLADRFGPGGGGDQHGFTSQLSPAQIADLVSYLESL
jgi:mono/diheme cytochrome c family protein